MRKHHTWNYELPTALNRQGKVLGYAIKNNIKIFLDLTFLLQLFFFPCLFVPRLIPFLHCKIKFKGWFLAGLAALYPLFCWFASGEPSEKLWNFSRFPPPPPKKKHHHAPLPFGSLSFKVTDYHFINLEERAIHCIEYRTQKLLYFVIDFRTV